MAIKVLPVARTTWQAHVDYLNQEWAPGQHCSIIAPAGFGKSILVSKGLMPLWRDARAIILDIKGDDPSLRIGRRLGRWPNLLDRKLLDQRKQPEWFRIVLPDSYSEARRLAATCLVRAYRETKWLVVCDELRALTDRASPNLNVGPLVDRIWVRGRSKLVTLLAATQAPRYVPASFYEQPTHVYIGPARDKRSRDRLEEIGGDMDAIDATLPTLQLYEFLYIGRVQEDGQRRMEVVRYPGS